MPIPYRRILVATDLSPASNAAVDAVEALCGDDSRAEVHLIHVVEPLAFAAPPQPLWLDFDRARVGDARRELERLATRLGNRLGDGAKVPIHLANGPASAEICAAAETVGAELIVVGTHGRTGVSHAIIG